MDLSAFVFVAVAVAWAVYLVPKAVRHQDEARRSRSVDRFSQTVRVLARRDAVSSRDARLVVGPPREAPAGARDRTESPAAPATDAQVRAGRLAARRATRRRRRVLGMILAATATVAALAVAGVLAPLWPAVPVSVLAAWLVACRVMVRGERATRDAMAASRGTGPSGPGAVVPVESWDVEDTEDTEDTEGVPDEDATTDEAAPAERTTGRDAAPTGRGLWDPLPMTLPTYVHKEAAVRRSVRTIDLDATGVWTSGRTDEDARIAQAEARRVARESGGEDDRAVGS